VSAEQAHLVPVRRDPRADALLERRRSLELAPLVQLEQDAHGLGEGRQPPVEALGGLVEDPRELAGGPHALAGGEESIDLPLARRLLLLPILLGGGLRRRGGRMFGSRRRAMGWIPWRRGLPLRGLCRVLLDEAAEPRESGSARQG
jgi:hypothetical protein